MNDRNRVGREASHTASALDNRGVNTIESGDPRGNDAGERLNGHKRQFLVDTDARALVLDPRPVNNQHRDGAGSVPRLSRQILPSDATPFADAGYAGDRPAIAMVVTVEIVRKPKGQVGYAVHPSRWLVERFFGRVSRSRRLWKTQKPPSRQPKPSFKPLP